MITWHKIADHINELQFQENNICLIEVKEKQMCLAKYNNELFVFAFQCPHAGGFLIDGYIDAQGNVVCPIHEYKYSIKNGRNVSGEGYYLKHWPVEIRDDGIYIGMVLNEQ
jgi:nitrite reductase/ring-hydroxylating ferredoxin subunit